jgi:hypothetical protein
MNTALMRGARARSLLALATLLLLAACAMAPDGPPGGSPSPVAIPSPVTSPAPSPAPSSPPSPSPTAEPPPATISPAPSQPPPTSSPLGPVRWGEASLIVAAEDDNDFDFLVMTLDSAGYVHAALSDGYPSHLIYVTNDGGTWSTEQVPTMPYEQDGDYDYPVALAVDDGATVHLAFSRGNDLLSMSGTYVVSRRDGGWTPPSLIVEGDSGADLATHDGTLHIVSWDERGTLRYLIVSANGDGTEDVIADSVVSADIELASDGIPQVLMETTGPPSEELADLRLATHADGQWVVDDLPDTEVFWPPRLALDDSGRPHIAWTNGYPGELLYAYRDGAWSEPIVLLGQSSVQHVSIAIDRDGNGHVLSGGYDVDLQYQATADGAPGTERLHPGPTAGNQLVIDDSGRLQVIFVIPVGPDAGLWYVIGQRG